MVKIPEKKIIEIAMHLIDEPGAMARLDIDPEKVKELSESIREVGLLQPISVRPVDDRYEIIAGHRRFLASKMLHKKTISCIVSDMDEKTTLIARATENLAREDISVVEEAIIYRDMMDRLGMTMDEIGQRMGKSPALVRRRLDLLRMPSCLSDAVHRKQITYSVAETLWSLGELPRIEYYLGYCIEHGATKEVVRQWVNDEKAMARQKDFAGEEAPQERAPYEKRPIYVTCDLCVGPMVLGQERLFRVCPDCGKAIETLKKGG
jgi:ParB family chromosome partitioning protein